MSQCPSARRNWSNSSMIKAMPGTHGVLAAAYDGLAWLARPSSKRSPLKHLSVFIGRLGIVPTASPLQKTRASHARFFSH